MYPVMFFDALRVKIRTDGVVANKAVRKRPRQTDRSNVETSDLKTLG
jgi:hypothetical protein